MIPRLDPLIHAPVRLSIMALLAGVREAEFSTVRDSVGISDSVLSKQASALEAAFYVKVRKGYVGKRPRTWLSLTPAGRDAFDAHVAALQQIVAQAGATVIPTLPPSCPPAAPTRGHPAGRVTSWGRHGERAGGPGRGTDKVSLPRVPSATSANNRPTPSSRTACTRSASSRSFLTGPAGRQDAARHPKTDRRQMGSGAAAPGLAHPVQMTCSTMIRRRRWERT